jgi:hypothetical protein
MVGVGDPVGFVAGTAVESGIGASVGRADWRVGFCVDAGIVTDGSGGDCVAASDPHPVKTTARIKGAKNSQGIRMK